MKAATTSTEQPRIYVACLAAYNNGDLHGAWIDAAQDAWEVWSHINAMLAASPVAGAEEYAIHDYEGFGGVRLTEYEGIEHVTQLAAFVVEHGALGSALLDYYEGDLDEARETITERYLGCHPSLADYVQEITEDSIDIPKPLRFYIDWQAMARDAELNGDLFALATAWDEVHVFAGG